MDFGEYLDELADGSKKLTVASLQRLSQLNHEQRAELNRRWPEIDVRRRRRLVQELIDLSEDNVDLNFDAVFSAGSTTTTATCAWSRCAASGSTSPPASSAR